MRELILTEEEFQLIVDELFIRKMDLKGQGRDDLARDIEDLLEKINPDD